MVAMGAAAVMLGVPFVVVLVAVAVSGATLALSSWAG
jgi:hypothetical protein